MTILNLISTMVQLPKLFLRKTPITLQFLTFCLLVFHQSESVALNPNNIKISKYFTIAVQQNNDGELTWTEPRIRFVADAINEFEKTLPNFIEQIVKNGGGQIMLFKPDDSYAAYVDISTKALCITTRIFEDDNSGIIWGDGVGNQPYGKLVLLHELSHIYDNRDVSFLPAYLKLTGWTAKPFDIVYPGATCQQEYQHKDFSLESIKKEIFAISGGDYYDDNYTKKLTVNQRSFARKRGFPSIYAMTGADNPCYTPEENFAEFATYIYLDPEASTYIDPAIIFWFKKYVLY